MTKDFILEKFIQELRTGDYEAFLTRPKPSYSLYELNDQKTERHYQVIFYLVFKTNGAIYRSRSPQFAGCAEAVAKNS